MLTVAACAIGEVWVLGPVTVTYCPGVSITIWPGLPFDGATEVAVMACVIGEVPV